ncbi:YbaB/EbfC family nucleoid-associated protein [Haloglycomyces albus]|uniref:YbaB/EbfC family nucleoid-associated protein n=1 Tax=Haloglycomyces albus TaxID=526067 RepID=UPI0004B8B477|nr:YbaB/EbfC family nucleoid-associated protein [Haloglycomyces albus]
MSDTSGGSDAMRDPQATLDKLESMQTKMRQRLDDLEAAKAELTSTKTSITDDSGAVTVTVSGRGEIDDIVITPTGLKMRESLGRIVTQTIEQAQNQHSTQTQNIRPGFMRGGG